MTPALFFDILHLKVNSFTPSCRKNPSFPANTVQSLCKFGVYVFWLGLIFAFSVDLFLGPIIPVTLTLIIQWLPRQVPGVIGSVL